jgi:hypothetical protein
VLTAGAAWGVLEIDSLAPEKFLSEHGINVVEVTRKPRPEKYELNYDKQELRIYGLILLASAAPAFFLWLC